MTDTNQASEEVRTKLALILGYERQEQHSSEKTRWYDLDEYGNPIEVTKKVDKVIDLLRTEKLKLLAEVRERVVGEDFEPPGFDERYSRQEGDNGHITHYETKKDAETINQHQEYQRTELAKLEAEL